MNYYVDLHDFTLSSLVTVTGIRYHLLNVFSLTTIVIIKLEDKMSFVCVSSEVTC